MDSQPPRHIGSMSPKATREARRLALPPEQKPGNPLGGMIGCLVAGAWCLFFAYWFKLDGAFLFIVGGLGFALITLGLVLTGVTVGEALTGRRRHG